MAPKDFKHKKYLDIKFASNNYSALLIKTPKTLDFHVIQDHLAHFEIGFAMTEPLVISVSKVNHIWIIVNSDDEEEPIITFHMDGIHTFTPVVVRVVLLLSEYALYNDIIGDDEMKRFLITIGYQGSLSKIGSLTRPNFRKEWSFFFDTISLAFIAKYTNLYDHPLLTQQIRYFLTQGLKFNFGIMLIRNNAMKISKNRNLVYYSSFLHLIFNHRLPNASFSNVVEMSTFTLNKRIFTDLGGKNNKKTQTETFPPLFYPNSIRSLLH